MTDEKLVQWKCSLCWVKVSTAVKPALGVRLCPKCLAAHWQRVMDIHKGAGDVKAYANAKVNYTNAKAAAKGGN